jgi:hypothetical protein
MLMILLESYKRSARAYFTSYSIFILPPYGHPLTYPKLCCRLPLVNSVNNVPEFSYFFVKVSFKKIAWKTLGLLGGLVIRFVVHACTENVNKEIIGNNSSPKATRRERKP